MSDRKTPEIGLRILMAYIPPHKRHLKDAEKPIPTPSSLLTQFERNLNMTSISNSMRKKGSHGMQGGKIVYAKDSIYRWWAVGLRDDGGFPTSVRLEPISCEPIERKRGEKPLVLVNGHSSGEASEVTESENKPWISIPKKIQLDLDTSFQNVRSEMESLESEEVKPSFVARFGKVFFHGGPSINSLDTISKSSSIDSNSNNQVSKSFYTNVPDAFMDALQWVVVPKIEFDFESEKEHYHVKIYDKSRPDVTFSCKCSVTKDDVLELHKVELNQLRYLVADISCLNKDLDLRLMLSTKRILRVLTDDEEHSIRELLKSAVLDHDVKGGLRWPLGKETFGDRFSVVGVWHTKYKAFKGLMMRLKLREADRFDFRSSTGEVTREVTLKMVGISKLLKDGMAEIGIVNKMLQDTLKLIWDHFLSF